MGEGSQPDAAMPAATWEPLVDISNNTITIDDVNITFQRTIRVPDNQNVSQLPAGLGVFPLEYVSDYAATLPASMAAKGGIFFQMYRK